jgi:hypothetical protein
MVVSKMVKSRVFTKRESDSRRSNGAGAAEVLPRLKPS